MKFNSIANISENKSSKSIEIGLKKGMNSKIGLIRVTIYCKAMSRLVSIRRGQLLLVLRLSVC